MDMLFGLVLLSVIAFVSWVGYLAYQEGIKIETSKRHGEAWLQWLGASSAKRFQPDFELVACAGVVPAVADLVTPAASIGNTASTALANSWGGGLQGLDPAGGALVRADQPLFQGSGSIGAQVRQVGPFGCRPFLF